MLPNAIGQGVVGLLAGVGQGVVSARALDVAGSREEEAFFGTAGTLAEAPVRRRFLIPIA